MEGADGRVDDGGPTLAKLNEFDNPFAGGPGPVPAFPTPCIRVVWNVPLGQSLNSRSVGVCLNIFNVPQGPVTIV
jgi:hypothetical protein